MTGGQRQTGAGELILFAATALVVGIAFALCTPPFREPDELFHFFRSAAIARGHLIPAGGPDKAPVPQGLRNFVFVMSLTGGDGKFHGQQFRQAMHISLERSDLRVVAFPAWFTPLPFLPQALTAFVLEALNARPLVIFYAGRVVNLLAALAVVLAAMRIASGQRSILAAVALLPMTLFQFASWSPDAMTIAAAFLLTASIFAATERVDTISSREVRLIAATAFVAGLCKPVYFLIALLVVAIPRYRFRSARHRMAVIGAVVSVMGVATAISLAYAHAGFYQQRGGLPIDPASQLRCIAADPLQFGRVFLHDLASNGWAYVEETIGRLGVGEIKLPMFVLVVEIGLLTFVALSCQLLITATGRVIALMIAALTVAGVIVSQYLSWSIICGDIIEGVQGRYFLPVLPVALAALAQRRPPWRLRPGMRTIAGVAILCNAVALVIVVRQYW